MTDPRWLDQREQRAWRGYLAMQSRLQAQLNRQLQADSGMSLPDFDVLVALTDRPAVRMRVRVLAEALQWEKSRLSHHLARMERRGLIERQDCPGDARGAVVVLTDVGRRAIERAAPAHVEAVRTLVFDGLDVDQVATLTDITEGVLNRIDARRAG